MSSKLSVLLWPLMIAFLVFLRFDIPASAQQCRGGPSVCRASAPAGALLHQPNSRGRLVWTTACGPNSSSAGPDPICREISACPAAGGFGKFLQAVTFDCKTKHFDGYFGLDGMTFGILDWTSNNLPPILAAFKNRNSSKYESIFGNLDLQMRDGCLDPNWACDKNKQGYFMCDAHFRPAFSAAVKDDDFQKAQVDVALGEYEGRLHRFSDLGLRTEYGNTALAVLANNLLNTEACRPATWKRRCASQRDETKLVDCMLAQYAENACRGGERRTSEDRVRAIKAVFAASAPSQNIHPTPKDVISCTDAWGRQ
jgi:hypothetical protein